MKSIELSSLTDKELAEKLASLKSELFNLRFTHASGSLSNSNELKVCKRNIARVKTVIRQRELGLAKAPESVKKATKKSTEASESAKKTTKKTIEAPESVKKTTKKSAKVDAEAKG